MFDNHLTGINTGNEGHLPQRLGHRPVKQYLVWHGHILRLDTGISDCQLDLGKKEDELSSSASSQIYKTLNKYYSIVLLVISYISTNKKYFKLLSLSRLYLILFLLALIDKFVFFLYFRSQRSHSFSLLDNLVTHSSNTRNIIYLLAEKYLNIMFPETSCPHRNVILILLHIFMMMSIKL